MEQRAREDPARQRRIDVRLAVSLALGIGGGLVVWELLGATVARLQGLLVTVIVSLFLSFAMEPAVQWLSRHGIRRGLAAGIVFVGAIVLLGGFVAAMVPVIVGQVRNLIAGGPAFLADLAQRAGGLPPEVGEPLSLWIEQRQASLPEQLPALLGDLGEGVLGVGQTLFGAILQFLTLLLVTFYLVADGPRLRRVLVGRLEPHRQRELLNVWEIAISQTGGYVYGRLLTAVVSAAVHVVAFSVVGLPYSIALGAWVGVVSSLIPVIGTYLAGALPLVIALATDPIDAVWVLVTIIVYQQVENYVIAPRITAATMQLHPAVAFVSVLVGGALLGVTGALLALPVTAIVAALIGTYGRRHEVLPHELTDTRDGDRDPGPDPDRRTRQRERLPTGGAGG